MPNELERSIALEALMSLGEILHDYHLEEKISDVDMERCEDLITMLEIYIRRDY